MCESTKCWRRLKSFLSGRCVVKRYLRGLPSLLYVLNIVVRSSSNIPAGVYYPCSLLVLMVLLLQGPSTAEWIHRQQRHKRINSAAVNPFRGATVVCYCRIWRLSFIFMLFSLLVCRWFKRPERCFTHYWDELRFLLVSRNGMNELKLNGLNKPVNLKCGDGLTVCVYEDLIEVSSSHKLGCAYLCMSAL